MSAATVASQLAMNAGRLPNGAMRTSVVGANVLPPSAPSRSNSDSMDAQMTGVERSASQPHNNADRPVISIKNGTAAVKDGSGRASGFTAVNNTGAERRSNSMSGGSPNLASTPKQSIGEPNEVSTASAPTTPVVGKDGGLASRFPYPGAIVVDK